MELSSSFPYGGAMTKEQYNFYTVIRAFGCIKPSASVYALRRLSCRPPLGRIELDLVVILTSSPRGFVRSHREILRAVQDLYRQIHSLQWRLRKPDKNQKMVTKEDVLKVLDITGTLSRPLHRLRSKGSVLRSWSFPQSCSTKYHQGCLKHDPLWSSTRRGDVCVPSFEIAHLTGRRLSPIPKSLPFALSGLSTYIEYTSHPMIFNLFNRSYPLNEIDPFNSSPESKSFFIDLSDSSSPSSPPRSRQQSYISFSGSSLSSLTSFTRRERPTSIYSLPVAYPPSRSSYLPSSLDKYDSSFQEESSVLEYPYENEDRDLANIDWRDFHIQLFDNVWHAKNSTHFTHDKLEYMMYTHNLSIL